MCICIGFQRVDAKQPFHAMIIFRLLRDRFLQSILCIVGIQEADTLHTHMINYTHM